MGPFVAPITAVGVNGASIATPLSLCTHFPNVDTSVLIAIITHKFKAADLHKLNPTNCNKETAYMFNGLTNQFKISHHAAKEYKNHFLVLIPLQTYFWILAFHVNNTSAMDTFWDLVASGLGSLMLNLNLKSTFYHIPMHRSDWPLLGFEWMGKLYHDIVLAFGACSAPYVFNLFVEALHWILQHNIPAHMHHYLNNFLAIFAPATPSALVYKSLTWALEFSSQLGLTFQPTKIMSPDTTIEFLGLGRPPTLSPTCLSPSQCPAKPPNPRPPSTPTPGNSDASPANSNDPLANSNTFSTVLDTSPEPLEPSPATPDPAIHL
ncbi:hypothetical protein E4T56_gene413 [Termitomyces sp. T112]|nr:hypothetical protein E4T56_gene413 [Termitomyces sp. T112]